MKNTSIVPSNLKDNYSKGNRNPIDIIERSLIHLTQRELEVIKYMHNGLGRKEIAEKMKISVKTVSQHTENIKTKLNFKRIQQIYSLTI